MINTTNCLKIGIMLIYKKITNKNQLKKDITSTEEMKLKILKSHKIYLMMTKIFKRFKHPDLVFNVCLRTKKGTNLKRQ